jgi:acetylornithine deacetylase
MNESIALLENLVGIDSVNPSLVPDGAGETEIANFIKTWLQTRGFETHWLENTPGRPSVVGVLKGSGGGKSLMLNGHIDTVTLAGNPDGTSPRIENGKMFARGAYDMKCGVAAMLVAASRASKLNLRGDVIVACVSDEEYASIGSFELIKTFKADAAIVTEPTELELVTAHKGFVWLTIETHGIAAHGSRPLEGVDAIAKMGKVLVALEQMDLHLRGNPTHALLESGSVHASIINGGQELSSYPAHCKLEVERRTIPGETLEVIETQFRQMLESIKATDSSFEYSLTMGLGRVPHEVSESEEIVQILLKNAIGILEKTPKIRAETFWTDCAALSSVGIPSFLFGAFGAGAHSANEWVDLNSVVQLEEILFSTIEEFCS